MQAVDHASCRALAESFTDHAAQIALGTSPGMQIYCVQPMRASHEACAGDLIINYNTHGTAPDALPLGDPYDDPYTRGQCVTDTHDNSSDRGDVHEHDGGAPDANDDFYSNDYNANEYSYADDDNPLNDCNSDARSGDADDDYEAHEYSYDEDGASYDDYGNDEYLDEYYDAHNNYGGGAYDDYDDDG